MGLLRPSHGRSPDPYAAYCFDEACFIWGSYVESEIEKATKKVKNEKEAARKIQMVMRRIFQEEEVTHDNEGRELPPVKTAPKQFRDPSSVIRVGE